MGKWFTEKDKNFIRDNWGKLSPFEISNILKCKQDTLLHFASRDNLRIRTLWTSKMDNVLYEYYPVHDWKNIEFYLSGISREQIYNRVSQLKIKAEPFWSEEEKNLLLELYPHYSTKYIINNYFPERKKYHIDHMAQRLKIKKTRKMTLYDKTKMLKDLVNLSVSLQRTPLGEELSHYGLPSQKSYERYFGGYREACKLCGLKINMSLFGKESGFYSKNNDVCYSLQEVIITNFFIENDIEYQKEVLYSSISNDERFGTKRMDWFLLENEIIVEFFGLNGNKHYIPKMNKKIGLCKELKLNTIFLYQKDITKLEKIFL